MTNVSEFAHEYFWSIRKKLQKKKEQGNQVKSNCRKEQYRIGLNAIIVASYFNLHDVKNRIETYYEQKNKEKK